MSDKASFFSRKPKITTQSQMQEVLAMRTHAKLESPDAAKPSALTWADPVKHGDGTGFQVESTGSFSVVREKDSAKGPQSFVYRLFDRREGKLLSSHDTAQKAREAAQEIANETT